MESLLGWAQDEQSHAAQRRSAEDAQLQNALAGAQTQEEKNTILQNAKTKNPGYVESLIARLRGKPAPAPFTGPAPTVTTQQGAITNPETGEQISAGSPQTVTGPAPKLKSRDEATAQWAAKGVAPEQQQQDRANKQAGWQANFNRQQAGPDLEAKVKAVNSSLDAAGITDPATRQRALQASLGVKQPSVYEQKMEDYNSAVENGYKGSPEQFLAEEAAKGRAAGGPVKPPTMKSGTVNGKNAFAYYSMDQKSWIDSNTGQPVKNFVPAPTFSQTGLWGLDTGYDAQGNPVPVLLDRRSGRVVPAPSGIIAPMQAKGIEGQRTAAIAGDSLLRTMMGAAERAKAGDQQAMLSVVANHIGMTLGAQKGARINQAVWNEATESAPWLQNIEKKFGPDGYLQGVKLSPQQVDQMVELGKLRRDVMWQQASQTAQASGIPLGIPEFNLQQPAPAPKKQAAQGGEKKKWSKSKWAAANQGKDANAAAAQAAAQGREVVE